MRIIPRFGRTPALMIFSAALCALAGCSKFARLSDSEKISQVTFNSGGSRSMLAPGTPQAAGVFIWGESDTEKFALFMASDTVAAKEGLKRGTWTFHAMGWETLRLQGNVRCGSTVKEVTAATTEVTINLEAINCDDDTFFGNSNFLYNTEPQTVSVVTCKDFATVVNGSSNCDVTARGSLRSYRVQLGAYHPTPKSAVPVPYDIVENNTCANLPSVNLGTSITNSLAKVPVGSGAGSPIYTVIKAFSVSTCPTAGGISFIYPNGLGAISNSGTSDRLFDDATKSVVYLAYGSPSPAPAITSVSPNVGVPSRGSELTITGTGFVISPTVTVGGTPCTSPAVTSTTITCSLPGLSTLGPKDVVVTNQDSQTVTLTAGFTDIFSLHNGENGVSTRGAGTAIDTGGNIIVAGYTQGPLDGEMNTGIKDLFVSKYSPSGVKQWTRLLGVTSKSTEATGVAVDTTDNIFVTGNTDGALDGQTLVGLDGAFLTKYSPTGVKQFTRIVDASGSRTYSYGIAIKGTTEVYITGYTLGSLPGNSLAGAADMFVAKFNGADNPPSWIKQIGTNSVQAHAKGVAVDSSGFVYAVGEADGGFNGGTPNGAWNYFVTRLNSIGTHQWTIEGGAGAGSSTHGNAITVDGGGAIIIAGDTNAALPTQSLVGTYDGFIIKLTSGAGAITFTKQFGATGQLTAARGVSYDSSNSILVTGETWGNLNGETIHGSVDSFAAKYSSAGVHTWTSLMGVAGAMAFGLGIASDSSGNVFTTGYTNGAISGLPRVGSEDYILHKFNSGGGQQ